jgi:arylsulfatase A-like enzyme
MEKKNVLVVMADAMRADRLSCTGYRRDGKKLTPNIDELAEEGVLYKKAYATGPWTGASQPAFLTGEYCSNIGWPSKGTPLGEDYRTIGNFFKEEGYETRAYNMSLQIRADLGFDRGFDYYEDIPLKDRIEFDVQHLEGMAWNVIFGQDDRTRYGLKKMKKWLGNRNNDKPFFAFWNPVNPHNKYKAPRKFRKKFEREIEPRMDKEAIEKVADWGHCLEYTAGNLDLTEEEMDVVESKYDAEIAYLDHRFGQLINKLKEEGIYDDTIVVFTSDHGENFGDYERLLYHDIGLNEGLTRVPLVISGGSFRDEEFHQPVSLIDLLNSLLKEATKSEIDDIESKPYLLPKEDNRDIVLMERDLGQKGMVEELKNLNPPKDLEWYRRGLTAAVKEDSKLVKDSNGKKEEFIIEEFKQVKSDLDESLVLELETAIDENLGSFSGEEEKVEKEIKEELEKMGYL